MRRLLSLTLLLVAACAPLTAPPPVRELSGVLNGTTHLAGEVLVVDDLLVPQGSTLVVAAGTTLRIRAASGTQIDPEYLSPLTEILVRGTLRIDGSADRPVRLLPEVPAATGMIAWAGLILDGATESRIAGAEITQAEQGIAVIAADPELVGNTVRGCRYGVVAQHGSAPLIVNNLIADGEGGVFCWSGSHPRLTGNRIVGQSEEGVFVDAASRPLLEANQISGNGIGLAIAPRDLPFDAGGIAGNREDVRWLATGGGGP